MSSFTSSSSAPTARRSDRDATILDRLQIDLAHPPFVQRGLDQGACCAHGFERGQIDGVAYAGIDFTLTGDRHDRGKPREIGARAAADTLKSHGNHLARPKSGSDRISAGP